MLSQEYTEAISETLDILNHTDQTYVSKISQKFLSYLSKNTSPTYTPTLDHTKPLTELPLKPKTKTLLTIIYRNYWCNEQQKQELDKKLKENELKYQAEMREKYNPDDVFKNKIKKEEENTQNLAIVEYKETIFKKIWNWIKHLIGK